MFFSSISMSIISKKPSDSVHFHLLSIERETPLFPNGTILEVTEVMRGCGALNDSLFQRPISIPAIFGSKGRFYVQSGKVIFTAVHSLKWRSL